MYREHGVPDPLFSWFCEDPPTQRGFPSLLASPYWLCSLLAGGVLGHVQAAGQKPAKVIQMVPSLILGGWPLP